MFEIQSHAELIAQPIESGNRDIVGGLTRELWAIRSEVRGIGPARIAASRVLDLDYFRAKAREDQRGEGPGQRNGQVENSDSIKGLIQVYFSR